jgi:hypothetical protein
MTLIAWFLCKESPFAHGDINPLFGSRVSRDGLEERRSERRGPQSDLSRAAGARSPSLTTTPRVGFAPTHLAGFGKLLVIVEMSDTEVSPAKQGLKVGELQNPRSDAAARWIVSLLLLVDRKENFLKDVFRLRLVSDDTERDGENLAAVAMKQQREAVRTPLNYVAQQIIVRERIEMLMRRHCVLGIIGTAAEPTQASPSEIFLNTVTQIAVLKKYVSTIGRPSALRLGMLRVI